MKMTNRLLPEKTVERLSKYRRILLRKIDECKEYIYSHELADLLHITSVQIRHDMMLLGHNAIPGKGYHIKQLIKSIDKQIEHGNTINAAVIGIGKLGHAFLKDLNKRNGHLRVVAAFDNAPAKVNSIIEGIECHHIRMFPEIARLYHISIGIIATNREAANEVKEILVKSNIKGILNYTTTPLVVPDDVFLEEHDLITSLEKVAYFVKNKSEKNYQLSLLP